MKRLVMLATAAGLLIGAVSSGFAAEATDKAVKARRGFFQAMFFNAAPLFGMLKGKVEYNADTAKKLANNIKLITMMQNDAMWKAGTDMEALKGQTRALPAIWKDMAGFNQKWDNWRKAAAELADAAGNGKDAFVEKMKALGGACGACHKAYRNKEF